MPNRRSAICISAQRLCSRACVPTARSKSHCLNFSILDPGSIIPSHPLQALRNHPRLPISIKFSFAKLLRTLIMPTPVNLLFRHRTVVKCQASKILVSATRLRGSLDCLSFAKAVAVGFWIALRTDCSGMVLEFDIAIEGLLYSL